MKALSMWELEAALRGWIEAHGSEAGNTLSAEEEDDLWQGVMDRM